VAVALLLFIALSLSSAHFLTKSNLLNVGDQWAPIAVMAVGGTFVVIVGGFDLSIGAIYLVAGVITVQVAGSNLGVLGIAAGVAAGTAMGALNGLLISVGRLNDFVVTIGSSIVFGGLAEVLTNGETATSTSTALTDIGFSQPLGVPLSIFVAAVVILLSSVALSRTTFGSRLYAAGGNRVAARLSGLRVGGLRVSAYALSGLGGGIAAAIVVSQTQSAQAVQGDTAFNVWTAILLGGNALGGGRGAIWRTVIGVLLLALIRNGFDLLNINPIYQQMATGAILLAAVTVDAIVRRRELGNH
jgi:ribose transport system permease protein